MTNLAKRPLFVRDATGLVREISPYGAFLLNYMTMSSPYMLYFVAVGQGLFPGADFVIASLLTLVPVWIISLLFAQLSTAYPRSGGEYVFVGRVLHPSLGFMINFVTVIMNISFIGFNGVLLVTIGIVPMLQSLSAITGNPGLATLASSINTNTNILIIASIFAIVLPLTLLLGTRAAFRAMTLLFIPSLVSLLVFVAVVGVMPREQFIANFNLLSGTTYDAVISAASKAGANFNFDLPGTAVYGLVYTFLAAWGFMYSSTVSGEVKNPKHSQLFGMMISSTLYLVLMAVTTAVAYNAMGHTFLSSISYLALNGNSAYTLPISLPIWQFLASYGARNVIFTLILSAGVIAADLSQLGYSVTFWVTRCFFAWSFDSLLPKKFAVVSDRGVPQYSLFAIIALSVLFVGLVIYTPIGAYMTYLISGAMFSLVIISIAAIMFPIWHKEVFSTTPSLVSRKVGGFPIISLVGVITIPIGILFTWASMVPAIAGPINPLYITFAIGLFIAGFALYWISYLVQKKRGVPMDLILKEIPPE